MRNFLTLWRRATLIAVLLCSWACIHAQNESRSLWDRMSDPNTKLEDLRQELDAFYSPREGIKHSGYKPYQRWLYRMERRLGEGGTLNGPSEIRNEIEAYELNQAAASGKRTSFHPAWRQVGPISKPRYNGIGRVNALAVDPTNANILYAGAATGGLWKTTDGGTTWADITGAIPTLAISSIAIHPTSPSTLFVGTGDENHATDQPAKGVWKSTNGGNLWTQMPTIGNEIISDLLFHPTKPAIVVATALNGKIFRSTNTGSSWTAVLTGPVLKDLAVHPSNPKIMYATGIEFYKSSNEGKNWSRITSGIPTSGVVRMELSTSLNQPNWVYFAAAGADTMVGIYKSTNSGTSFVKVNSSRLNNIGGDILGGQGYYNLVMLADRSNANILFTGGVSANKSTDGGVTWQSMGEVSASVLHADKHAILQSPLSSRLLIATDGGIHYTTDGGASFSDISSGITITQSYFTGLCRNASRMMTGTQDNGTLFRNRDFWSDLSGGDGMECFGSPLDDKRLFYSTQSGTLYRSLDGGITADMISNGIYENGLWTTLLRGNPNDDNILFTGRQNIWRCQNAVTAGSGTQVIWTNISNLPVAPSDYAKVQAMEISASNPNVMYFTRSTNVTFWKTSNLLDPAPAWTNLSSFLPSGIGTIYAIGIHGTNPDKIWISTYNSATVANRIYFSSDGGQTWVNQTGTLPNVPYNSFAFDNRSTDETIYLGTDAGVFYRNNTLSDWVSYGTGFPSKVSVNEIEIYYDQSCDGGDKLVAGTWGRGIWETDLKSPTTLIPSACFSFSGAADICAGQAVSFSDKSSNNPNSWNWAFNPGSVAFLNGTSASSQNPVVRFLSSGTYSVSLTVSNANGWNTQVQNNILNVGNPGNSVPVYENFETTTANCSPFGLCSSNPCNLSGYWTNELVFEEDDLEWERYNGTFPLPFGNNSGSALDYDPGTTSGKYVFIHAFSCHQRTAGLKSTCISLAGLNSAQISFAYHMWGSEVGEIHLDIYHNGAWIYDIMPVITGDQGNQWNTRSVSLNAYLGGTIQLRFRGINTKPGQLSEMLLDAINVTGTLSPPMKSLSFSGEKRSEGNLLDWSRGSCISSDHFILEKLLPSGELLSLHQDFAGEKDAFSFIDRKPLPGINRYKLTLIHEDGNSETAGWVELLNDEGYLNVFPNPTSGIFNLQFGNFVPGNSEVLVRDITGKIHTAVPIEIREGQNQIELNLENLSSGTWILSLEGQNFRFVLQR